MPPALDLSSWFPTVTEALFEYYVGLANTASATLGAYGDIQGVQSYAALSTGTSQHWDG